VRKDLVDHVRDATFMARREHHRDLLDTQDLPEWVGPELLRLQRSFQFARGPKKRRATALSFERAVQRRALRFADTGDVPTAVWRRIVLRFAVAARQGRGLTLDPETVRAVNARLNRRYNA
jgi:hypothetical protein